jgi:hypothetical protein
MKAIAASLFLLMPQLLPAQNDSLRLSCPLHEATVVPPPRNAIRYDPPDLCVVLTSVPDTIVKSVAAARVTNIEQDEEGKYGVVLFVRHGSKEYYLWYTGLSRLMVKKNDRVARDQPLGTIVSGNRIELLMYDFETPVDPVKYLDCKGVLVNNQP